ncbi:MAG: DUF5320 domain-containing protein [Clostridiales bacterium]|jgi:hypothetical protein|nr:DUF5320 domain-containing protein [Clostridiales bacterium]
MPRGDGTGPYGFGPFTGRGAGYCAGYDVPGYANPMGFRRGFSRGMGLGRGRGLGLGRAPYWGGYYTPYDAPYEAVDEKKVLKQQADFLEDQLEQIKKRLSSIEEEAE